MIFENITRKILYNIPSSRIMEKNKKKTEIPTSTVNNNRFR